MKEVKNNADGSDTTTKEPKKLTIDDLLKNKKIKIKPIIRGGGAYAKGHDGEFRFTGAKFSTCLRKDRTSGNLIAIFNPEEREVLENAMSLPKGHLNFYDKQSPYWTKFRIQLGKEDRILDLSKIQDFISYKILKEDPRIAGSWEDRNDDPIFEYALVDEEDSIKVTASATDRKLKAWGMFDKIKENNAKMQKILRLSGTLNKFSQYKSDFLVAKIGSLLESDQGLTSFLEICEDKHFDCKILIEQALECRALERGAKSQYLLKGGDVIGDSLQSTIEYLESPKNQDVFLRIEAQCSEYMKKFI